MEGLVVKGHFLAVAEVEAEQVDTQRQLVLGVLEVLVEKVESKSCFTDELQPRKRGFGGDLLSSR
jgi:hypothetical protein